MNSPAVDQKLFSLESAAKTLGNVSVWTLRRHLALGSFRAVRIGKRVLLSQETVERIARAGLPSLPAPNKNKEKNHEVNEKG